MSRLQKIDPATLEREYVYADPPISVTALADKYGLARSGVADKARIGKWYEKRQEFQQKLGAKTLEALADEWAAFGTKMRKSVMEAATRSVESYSSALVDKEGNVIPGKVSGKDAVAWVGVMRDLLADVERAARPVTIIDQERVDIDPEEAAKMLADVEKLLGSGTSDAT